MKPCGKRIHASFSKARGWGNYWECNLQEGHKGQHRRERG